MVSDVHPDLEAGAVVRGLKCGEHLKKIIQHVRLAGDDAPHLLSAGKFRQHLGHSYPSDYPAQYMVGCTMNGGASGGPWFTTYKGRTYLVSNNSLSDRSTFITGPRLGKNAKQVYLATSNKFK